ncbi:MAG: hypothetical protein ACREU9_07050 [Gammaproteobacteria bacterium]
MPFLGSVPLLYGVILIFIGANLTLGITFSSKGRGWYDLWPNVWPLAAFMLAVIALGLKFYQRTLD